MGRNSQYAHPIFDLVPNTPRQLVTMPNIPPETDVWDRATALNSLGHIWGIRERCGDGLAKNPFHRY